MATVGPRHKESQSLRGLQQSMFCSGSWNHLGIRWAALLNLASRGTQNLLRARFRTDVRSLLPTLLTTRYKPHHTGHVGNYTLHSPPQWPQHQTHRAKGMNTETGKAKDHFGDETCFPPRFILRGMHFFRCTSKLVGGIFMNCS